ncbi:MAG: VWA domain-containing protein [Candidatus Omnitrophica bacterium]|nr:VWA domain-containing protein [Candidatus Omnitrophota bacterium]
MTFHDPWWFTSLGGLIGLWWLALRRARPALRFPSVNGLTLVMHRSRAGWLRVPAWLRLTALALITAALARPQLGLEATKVSAEGIDIVLAVDVSSSMLAEDFTLRGRRTNRLEVVKDVVKDFVDHRPNDRIGLVIFAGRPYTQCPLTLDHGWLLRCLTQAQIGMVEDGTAIGSGIATSLNRLRSSKANSRVMVLLTDGVNNAGAITPEAAAQLAKALKVKMYAVGAGTKGAAPFPVKNAFGQTVYQPVQIDVDDEGLTRIAEETGGTYFRATDTDSLKQTYAHIDQMETTVIEQPRYLTYQEWYPWFVIPALLVLLVELVLANTWLRVLP